MKAEEISGSEDFWKLNPHLRSVGGLPGAHGESIRRDAAQAAHEGKTHRKGGVERGSLKRGSDRVRYRVTITSHRRTDRRIDGENLSRGFKHLRDAIARSLGQDDNEDFITWDYGQIETHGRRGTVVTIAKL